MKTIEKSKFESVATIAFGVTLAAVHLWAVVLCFQVNSGAWMWISALFTIGMPFVAELFWGIWAMKHGNPFLYGAILLFATMGAMGLLDLKAKQKP